MIMIQNFNKKKGLNLSLAYLIIITFFLFNCDNKVKKNEVIVNPNLVVEDVLIKEKCVLIDSFEIYIIRIRENGFKPQNYDDTCVLKFVDKLSFISINTPLYLNDLNIVSDISDGYLSEHFMSVLSNQFYNNFDNLMRYLFLNRKSRLNNFLIEELSMKVSLKGEKEKIQKHINNKIKSIESEDYIEFVKNVEAKIDPSMFE